MITLLSVRPNIITAFRVIGIGFALQLAASIVMLSVGTVIINVTTGQESTDVMAHPWPTLAGAMLAQGLMGPFLYRLARHICQRRTGFDPVPLYFDTAGAKQFGLGLAIGGAFIGVVIALLSLLGLYHPTGLHLTPGILYGLALGVGAALVEEPAYRGIMLGGLGQLMSRPWAVALSSVIFGLAHLVAGGAAGANEWGGVVGIILVSSLIFAGAYYLTGRLWLGIGIHLAWNFTLGGIFGLPVSGVPAIEGLISHAPVTGPTLLTGGTFGPEGSVILVVVGLLLGLGLMMAAQQKARAYTTYLE